MKKVGQRFLRPFKNKKALGGSDESGVGEKGMNWGVFAVIVVLVVIGVAFFVPKAKGYFESAKTQFNTLDGLMNP